MATIRDVAQAAGVSVGTVSACINASAPVSEALRRRVDQAIERTGYRPDALARSLKTGVTRTLGLVVSDLAAPFAASIAQGAADTAQSQGYALLLAVSAGSPETEESCLGFLAARRVDGAILLPTAVGAKDLQRWRGAFDAPVLVIGNPPKDCPFDSVAADYTEGASVAADHLAGLGHNCIALVIGPGLAAHDAECLAGYRRALERRGIAFRPRLVRVAGARPGQAQDTARALLAAPERPTAILACGGTLALSVLGVFASLGLKCPEDVSLVSLGDGDWAAAAAPAITAIADPARKIGAEAARMLLERLQGGAALPPRRAPVSCALNLRQSAGPASRA